MSQEQARACLEKMKTDGVFRVRVRAAVDAAARLQLINAEGFACSPAELEAASAELNDSDLDRIAGGQTFEDNLHSEIVRVGGSQPSRKK